MTPSQKPEDEGAGSQAPHAARGADPQGSPSVEGQRAYLVAPPRHLLGRAEAALGNYGDAEQIYRSALENLKKFGLSSTEAPATSAPISRRPSSIRTPSRGWTSP